MTAFAIGALGMIGVPSVGGFITKWYLLLGALERESLTVLFVLLTSTLLNASYFVPIIYKAFFEKEQEGHHHHNEEIKENPMMVAPLFLCAVMSVILGLYPDFIVNIANQIIR
jgi:multicomponent Na+:H+ antiporter subunit D